jgi:hypothetical protein
MGSHDQPDESLERAAQRASWPVRRCALGEESDDLSKQTTATERIAMMWPLALEAWRVAGLPIPDYERKDAPIRVLHRLTGPLGSAGADTLEGQSEPREGS